MKLSTTKRNLLHVGTVSLVDICGSLWLQYEVFTFSKRHPGYMYINRWYLYEFKSALYRNSYCWENVPDLGECFINTYVLSSDD